MSAGGVLALAGKLVAAIAAGCSADELEQAAVIVHAVLPAPRSPAAIRQARYRKRNVERNGVTPSVTSSDAHVVTGGRGGSDPGSDSPSLGSPSPSEQIREELIHVTDGAVPPSLAGTRLYAILEAFTAGVGGVYTSPTPAERRAVGPALEAHLRALPLGEWQAKARTLGAGWRAACVAAGLPGPLPWFKARDWLGMDAPAVYSNGGPAPKYTPQALAPKAKRLWSTPAEDPTGAAPTARTSPSTTTEPHAHGTTRAAGPDPAPAAEPLRPAAAH